MKLPSLKKILREDVKEIGEKIGPVIDIVNNFMETVYQSLNKNITFTENIASSVKEITVRTSSTYPAMERIEFLTGLKTRAIGLQVIQAYEKGSYVPAEGPVYAGWVEENGTVVISNITGLEASKVYIIRLLVI